jgi:hypothetical protein
MSDSVPITVHRGDLNFTVIARLAHDSIERGMGSVKRLEFDALPREGGWDYIYLNDNVQGSKGSVK